MIMPLSGGEARLTASFSLLLLLLLLETEALVLKDNGRVIPTIYLENCASKAQQLVGTQDVLVVALNYSLTDFMTMKVDVAPTNNSSTTQLLYFDRGRYQPFPVYFGDALPAVAAHGFNGLIVGMSQSDMTFNSWIMLRFWRNRDCPVPLLLVGDDAFSSVFLGNQQQQQVLVNIDDFQENLVKQFIRTPQYIMGVSIPSYIVATALCALSLFKLRGIGFPRVMNSGTLLCILGIVLSIFMFIATSECQNQQSTMPWIGVQLLIIIVVTISACGSFIISYQFHRAVSKTSGDNSSSTRCACCRKNWSIYLSSTLFILHVLLFIISGVIFAVQPDGGDFGAATFTSITYAFFKVYISIYFFWGHWQVYKVFRRTSDAGGRRLQSRDAAHHIGRRLGLISAVNLLGLILAFMYSTPSLSQYHHGWVMLIWMSILMGLTMLLEIMAVPSGEDRLNKSGNLGSASSISNRAAFLLDCCFPKPPQDPGVSKSSQRDIRIEAAHTSGTL